MKSRLQGLFLACIFALFFSSAAFAQLGAIDLGLGFGAAQAKAASTGVDSTTLATCSLTASGCLPTPKLNNFMLGFSGNVLLFNKFGVGAEVSMQPVKQDYITLATTDTSGYSEKIQSRLTFYDFNAIYRPLSVPKAALQLEGGIGGAHLSFFDTAASATSLLGTTSQSSQVGTVNKFQMHVGAGVQIFVKGNFFIRPQFDLHYVPKLDQFGTNLVKQETVWIGYSFGR